MTEIHNGTKATCRYCGHEIIYEPWFRDGREPNEPVWSHIRSGTKSCSTRPVGWAADNWPFASPASRDGEEVAARTASGQQPETTPCGHCKGSGADPEDEGDYLPEVHRHNPFSVGPCPECNGEGTAVGQPAEAQAADEARPPRTTWRTESLETDGFETTWTVEDETR
jgi:hypothetical protein